jgi:hypothetical protein
MAGRKFDTFQPGILDLPDWAEAAQIDTRQYARLVQR